MRRKTKRRSKRELKKAFFANVNKLPGRNACWEWQGPRCYKYGSTSILGRGRTRLAHRVSYELAFGPIGDVKMLVCHKCDNPLCVRPSHFFLGTNAENYRDCVAKGRHRHGANYPHTPMGQLKARVIRSEFAGVRSHAVLADVARQYNTSIHVIKAIVNNRSFKDAEGQLSLLDPKETLL